jgi:hypothetical protein
LRKEAPERYESYHGAEQPCLIVNDLKLEPVQGRVALWVGPGTEGYLSNLKIAAK